MKNENELKDLLDRLRVEVRSVPGAGAGAPEKPAGGPQEGPEKFRPLVPFNRPPRPDKPSPARFEFSRPERVASTSAPNIVWSENKEAMLFGVLASLAAALGGILAGQDHIVLAGTVAFMLFSFVMVLTLFGYYISFRGNGQAAPSPGARLEQLSRRLDSLEERLLSGKAGSVESAGPLKDRELEQKVEELRKVVKSLVKAVDQGGSGG